MVRFGKLAECSIRTEGDRCMRKKNPWEVLGFAGRFAAAGTRGQRGKREVVRHTSSGQGGYCSTAACTSTQRFTDPSRSTSTSSALAQGGRVARRTSQPRPTMLSRGAARLAALPLVAPPLVAPLRPEARGLAKKAKAPAKSAATTAKSAASAAAVLSSPTVLGSNILKDGKDAELKPDSEYPEWIWTLHKPQPSVQDLMAAHQADPDALSMEDQKRLYKLWNKSRIKERNDLTRK